MFFVSRLELLPRQTGICGTVGAKECESVSASLTLEAGEH